MAYPAEKQPDAPKAEDWVDVYYTPAPANTAAAPRPEMTALAQMYAYYEA